MRKFKLLLLGLVSVISTQSSQAVIIENVTLGFDSGATWAGTITFNDNYEGMIDTDGYLNGGTNGFANEHFTWTWWEGNGFPNPTNSGVVAGNYNDWLMNGTPGVGYSMFIGLNWNPISSTLNGGIIFDSSNDPYYHGNYVFADPITSVRRGSIAQSVPDGGATVAMLSLAVGGMALVRRKMK